jgi:hypothetical protein
MFVASLFHAAETGISGSWCDGSAVIDVALTIFLSFTYCYQFHVLYLPGTPADFQLDYDFQGCDAV